MSRPFRWTALSLLLVALVALVGAGCSGSDALVGEIVPNSPPNTDVSSTPPNLDQTSFTVEFFWNGEDNDGRIIGYEWRISDNGRDGIIDVADTSGLAWNFTESTDSIFSVTADLSGFEGDVLNPAIDDSTNWRFWQTHTFFVRAIDEQGLRDPSPANVSFTATTLSPTVVIDLPSTATSNSCGDGPMALRFGWTGRDPDNPEGDPAFVRYLLLRYAAAGEPCMVRNDYLEENLIAAVPDSLWSDWVRYDAAQDSGKTVTFPPFPLNTAGTSYFFAVQARDKAGAVTPTFEWGRNVRHIRITPNKFPLLTVTERFLGTNQFVGTTQRKAFEIVSKQDVEFTWVADAESYGGIVEAYRYGYEIVDPEDNNDKGWAVPWGLGTNWQRTAPKRFAQGAPNFIVQVRDNSGSLSRAVYQFQVIQVASRDNQRPLLLVDDFDLGTTNPDLEESWDRQWNDLLINVTGFQSTDVIDVTEELGRLSFATVNEYKSVIWFGNSSAASFIKTQLAPRSRLAPQFNWLEAYQNFVGNILLCGPGVGGAALEPNLGLSYPIVFNTDQGGELGFGTRERPDGSEINIGTERWPYTGWCLELLDVVRPAPPSIFAEVGGRLERKKECADLTYAFLTPEFVAANPEAEKLLDLTPRAERDKQNIDVTPDWPKYRQEFENFFQKNVTSRDVTLILRSCQVPMFSFVARRDVDDPLVMSNATTALIPPETVKLPLVEDVFCPSFDPDSVINFPSPLSGAPAAIASSSYSPFKQDGRLPTLDFLWGFHPLSFERSGVRASLEWMLLDHWGLNDD